LRKYVILIKIKKIEKILYELIDLRYRDNQILGTVGEWLVKMGELDEEVNKIKTELDKIKTEFNIKDGR